MQKKKLLFVSGHLNVGGAEKSLLDILRHIDYERYDVDLLLLQELGDYADMVPPQVRIILRPLLSTYGSLVKCLSKSFFRGDWFTFRMRLLMLKARYLGQKYFFPAGKLLLGKKHYDCAIGFRPDVCTQVAAYAVDADRCITWWHHGEFFGSHKLFQEYAAPCAAIVAVSDSCTRMLANEFPQLTAKMVTVPNMLDVVEVRNYADAFDPYADKSRMHIASVGRLSEEKHFENIILAAKVLKDNGNAFQWHMIGDGPLRTVLEDLAQSLNVSDCVIFEGNQVNPYPYIKHADLFVHPSYVESFGIVVTEALALGTPCVVTKSMGVMDFLVDGENAVLTEQNPEDLAEKVVLVLENSDLRRKLKENAQCPEQFFPKMVMQKIDALIMD